MTIGERITFYRIKNHMTVQTLADKLDVAKATISKYERGIITNIPSDKIEKLAQIFETTPAVLMGWTDEASTPPAANLEIPRWKRVPEIGDIAAGSPILAEQNFVGDVECPDDIDCDYALRVKGDSMIDDEIYDGDIVYIRQQPAVDNGQIAAVIIDGEATLKRYYMHRAPDGDVTVTLQPANKAYAPFVYRNAECENIIICGLAVGVFHKL